MKKIQIFFKPDHGCYCSDGPHGGYEAREVYDDGYLGGSLAFQTETREQAVQKAKEKYPEAEIV